MTDRKWAAAIATLTSLVSPGCRNTPIPAPAHVLPYVEPDLKAEMDRLTAPDGKMGGLLSYKDGVLKTDSKLLPLDGLLSVFESLENPPEVIKVRFREGQEWNISRHTAQELHEKVSGPLGRNVFILTDPSLKISTTTMGFIINTRVIDTIPVDQIATYARQALEESKKPTPPPLPVGTQLRAQARNPADKSLSR